MATTKKIIRVAIAHPMPFYLAHGGCQTMIQSIVAALHEDPEVAVCYDAWWETDLHADVIHYIGRPASPHMRMAKEKGYKTIFTDILDSTASRSRVALHGQKLLITALRKGLGHFAERMAWDTYRMTDAYVTIVPHESRVAQFLFGVTPEKCHVIPHGLGRATLQAFSRPQPAGDYLFNLATIHPRKRTLEVARLAKKNKIPVIFAGNPYTRQDPYYRAFTNEIDNVFVRYAGFVSEEEKIQLMTGARGFILLSDYESGCVAVHEAAAAGLPLLLSDAPWARLAYPSSDRIHYADVHRPANAGERMRQFYEQAARKAGTRTFPVYEWKHVAGEYKKLYQKLAGHP